MNGNGNSSHFRSPSPTPSSSASTSCFSPGHGQGQGKYVIRLSNLEEENVQLKSKIANLEKWKERMEVWMLEEFGVTINAEFDRPDSSEKTAFDSSSVSDDQSRPSTPSNLVVLKVESLSPDRNEGYSDSENFDYDYDYSATPTPSTSRQNHMTLAGNSNGCPPDQTASEDDTPCDVCGSPDSEENNEMLFCEGTGCTICVHQACYGIPVIPNGVWKCQTCSEGIAPGTERCLFCPTLGGAMTRCITPSRQQWAHVSCAWWISEVSFENPVLMKTVIKIPNIPKSRWSLICIICGLKKGACIQCSYGRCTVAFHVTCAHKHGFKMEIFDVDVTARKNGVSDPNTLRMNAYCKSHTNCEPPSPKKRRLTGKSPRGRQKKSV